MKKSKIYAVTGFPINHDIDSILVVVTGPDRQEAISNLIQRLVKEKKEPDIDLRIYNDKPFAKIIPFKKKSEPDIPPKKTYILKYNYKKSKKKLNSRNVWVYIRR